MQGPLDLGSAQKGDATSDYHAGMGAGARRLLALIVPAMTALAVLAPAGSQARVSRPDEH